MKLRVRSSVAAGVALGLVCWLSSSTGRSSAAEQGSPEQDAVPPAPESILREAFAQRFRVDFTSTIELVMRNRSGQELRRRFEAASKVIDGRVHSTGRLISPEYLRGMAFLTIEADSRSHDSFLYLPSLAKVRRVSTAQRGDSFLGSDVTYEDLERQDVEDFELTSMSRETWAGESVYRIGTRPLKNYNYAAAEFLVAESDGAILATYHYKHNQNEPYRVIAAPRAGMVAKDGYVFPTRLRVENFSRGTTTEVEFGELRINPEIDDRIFSLAALEQERKLRAEEEEEASEDPTPR